jgi:hypothetical protein
LAGRSFFVQDEWRWWERRLARDVYHDGDVYTARLSRFATTGWGGLALGYGTTWQETTEKGLPADPPFEHETYAPTYPIYPDGMPPQEGTQRTLAGFQVRTEVRAGPGGHSPLMKDGQLIKSPFRGEMPWVGRVEHRGLPERGQRCPQRPSTFGPVSCLASIDHQHNAGGVKGYVRGGAGKWLVESTTTRVVTILHLSSRLEPRPQPISCDGLGREGHRMFKS